MDSARGFAARRSATSNLPNFQLPTTDLNPKYSYAPQSQISQSAPQNVGSVLTPPGGLGADGVNAIPGVNSGSSQNSSNGASGVYNPSGYWPPPAGLTPQFSLMSGQPIPSPLSQTQNNMFPGPGRGLYSPTGNNNFGQQNRNMNSSVDENLPPPPHKLNFPPFPTGLSSGGPGPMTLPTLAQQHQNQQPQPGQQHNLQQQMSQDSQQQQQQAMQNSNDQYGPRPPPTPTYSYGSSSTPQQSTFPAFTQATQAQCSPITSGAPINRISPLTANHPNTMQPPPNNLSTYRPFNNQYSLPGLSNPLMPHNNLHGIGSQPLMMGQVGVSMPYIPMHSGQMYGMHPGNGANTQDKPCKCDQCPQSFNRNHDLKRHKRIHLAVKPFPCEDCEKRFSRKDALKVCLAY